MTDLTNASAKAAVLAEALPWLERLHGTTVVVKYGGNAMTDDALKASFAEDIVFLRLAGLRPVVVHGGGPQISAMLGRLGVDSEFKGGLRVTTPEVMDIVGMVLVGQVQRELVGLINEHGPYAVGMSGEDAHLFTAERRDAIVAGEPVDIGQVGDVVEVRPDFVTRLLDDGLIPVVSTVARDGDGVSLQRQCRHGGGSARHRAGGREARRAHRRRGPLRRLAQPRLHHPHDRRRAASRAAARPRERDGAEDGGLPACGRRGSAARARHRRPHPALRAAGGLHRLGRRHDGPARGGRRHDRMAGALAGRPHGQLRHAAADARPRAGRAGLGRRRHRVHRPAGRHRRQRPRARRSPAGGGGHRPAVDPRAHEQPRRDGAGDRARGAAGRPGRGSRCARVLLQLRRGGQRGRLQARPAHRPHAHGRGAEQLPRPDDGLPRPHGPAGQAGSVPAAARRRDRRAVRRRRGPRREPSGRRRRRSSSSRSRGRAASSSPRRATSRPPGASRTRRVRCWCSTRSRPASAGRAPGSPTSTRACARTS